MKSSTADFFSAEVHFQRRWNSLERRFRATQLVSCHRRRRRCWRRRRETRSTLRNCFLSLARYNGIIVKASAKKAQFSSSFVCPCKRSFNDRLKTSLIFFPLLLCLQIIGAAHIHPFFLHHPHKDEICSSTTPPGWKNDLFLCIKTLMNGLWHCGHTEEWEGEKKISRRHFKKKRGWNERSEKMSEWGNVSGLSRLGPRAALIFHHLTL